MDGLVFGSRYPGVCVVCPGQNLQHVENFKENSRIKFNNLVNQSFIQIPVVPLRCNLLVSFFGGFTTMVAMNPPEKKLEKRTSVCTATVQQDSSDPPLAIFSELGK